jgi:hypothetical protein
MLFIVPSISFSICGSVSVRFHDLSRALTGRGPDLCEMNYPATSAFSRQLNQEVVIMKSVLVGIGMIVAAATFASAEEVTVEKKVEQPANYKGWRLPRFARAKFPSMIPLFPV